ncbi:FMN-binding protein [Slackia heliotrinireducens]|uniref:FMN-binding protein n=1 Tax=Slackia heliotrinireducens TaxID=84110 RepID=UPI0033153EA2
MNGTYILDTWFTEEEPLTPSSTTYKDGTYEGEGNGIGLGYGGEPIPVTVTIEGGKITAVTPGDHNETPALGGQAIKHLAQRVLEANGVEGVDAVASATISSNGFLSAVKQALEQAE